MIDLLKKLSVIGAASVIIPLAAQEPWDPHLKLTAGLVSGVSENFIGQDKAYGLALAGAYPLTAANSCVFEFGYKFMPSATTSYDGWYSVDDRTNFYFASAMYRYELWRNGIYVQGGIRAANAQTIRRTNYSDGWEKDKAGRHTSAGWCFATGYRLTGLWSVEIGASSVGFKNISETTKNATVIEVALVIHR
jgi:hypothetical protein